MNIIKVRLTFLCLGSGNKEGGMVPIFEIDSAGKMVTPK
jgi:hypothetical protein